MASPSGNLLHFTPSSRADHSQDWHSWRKSADDEWSCSLHGRIITLRQDATHLHYKATYPSHSSAHAHGAPPTPPSSQAQSPSKTGLSSSSIAEDDDTEALLRRYFNLTLDLSSLYARWSAADPNFATKAPRFAGVRILRQDAWEALVGFICSSNNNIVRIAQMVHKLCAEYGRPLGPLTHTRTVVPIVKNEATGAAEEQPATTEQEQVQYYDFPTPADLAQPGVEATLRKLGFGYRARYIYETAVMICAKEKSWLESLRNPENPALASAAPLGEDVARQAAHTAGPMKPEGREGYRDAHAALLELQGVGPKVADCVCLMGLGWGEAVPVDTHVWQIAVRDYKFKGGNKHASLTKVLYDGVGAKFRGLWGEYAGWAHSVLFTADLRAFSDQLQGVVKVEKVEGGRKMKKTKVEDGVVERKVELVEKTVRVKRELDDDVDGIDDRKVVEVHEDMMSRVKRRRSSNKR